MRKSKGKVSRPGDTRPSSPWWRRVVGRSREKQDEAPNQTSCNDSVRTPDSALESNPESVESTDPTDLCLRAELLLSNDNKTKQLWRSYLEILKDDMPQLDQSATADRPNQLSKLLDAKAKELEARRTKIEFGDYELKVRNTLIKIFKTILSAKDLINTAAKPSPPAQLACAGVFIVLTVSQCQIHRQAIYVYVCMVSCVC
jgi:hypothetical protein